eukprot:5716701-Amphidinium_carterae.1
MRSLWAKTYRSYLVNPELPNPLQLQHKYLEMCDKLAVKLPLFASLNVPQLDAEEAPVRDAGV